MHTEAPDETRTTRGPTALAALAGLVVGAVLAAAGVALMLGHDETGVEVESEFTTTVTTVGPRSICVERTHDTCGVPLLVPEYDIKVGDRVTVTEVWLDYEGIDSLGFYIRPAAD